MTTTVDGGIRDLEEHLSEYVERVSRGELIRITLRDAPASTIGLLPANDRFHVGIAHEWTTLGVDEPPARVHQVEDVDDRPLAEDRGR